MLYSLAINDIDADYAKIFPGKAIPSEQKQLRGYILGRATSTGYYLGPIVAQDQVALMLAYACVGIRHVRAVPVSCSGGGACFTAIMRYFVLALVCA